MCTFVHFQDCYRSCSPHTWRASCFKNVLQWVYTRARLCSSTSLAHSNRWLCAANAPCVSICQPFSNTEYCGFCFSVRPRACVARASRTCRGNRYDDETKHFYRTTEPNANWFAVRLVGIVHVWVQVKPHRSAIVRANDTPSVSSATPLDVKCGCRRLFSRAFVVAGSALSFILDAIRCYNSLTPVHNNIDSNAESWQIRSSPGAYQNTSPNEWVLYVPSSDSLLFFSPEIESIVQPDFGANKRKIKISIANDEFQQIMQKYYAKVEDGVAKNECQFHRATTNVTITMAMDVSVSSQQHKSTRRVEWNDALALPGSWKRAFKRDTENDE